jgi:hypothetical protein
VRAFRIHDYRASARTDHEIHVFHRDCAKEHLVSEDQGSNETDSPVEGDPNRPDIWYGQFSTGRYTHLSLGFRLEV